MFKLPEEPVMENEDAPKDDDACSERAETQLAWLEAVTTRRDSDVGFYRISASSPSDRFRSS